MKRFIVLILILVPILALCTGCGAVVDLKYDGSGTVSLAVADESGGAEGIRESIREKIDYYNSSEGVKRFKLLPAKNEAGFTIIRVKFKNIRFLTNLSKILSSANAEFYYDDYDKLVGYNSSEILFVQSVADGQTYEAAQIKKSKYRALVIKNLDITGVDYLTINLPAKTAYVSVSGVEAVSGKSVRIYGAATPLGIVNGDGSVTVEDRNLVKKAIVLTAKRSNTPWIIGGTTGGAAILAGVIFILVKKGVFKRTAGREGLKYIKRNLDLYSMVIPGFVLMLIFCYIPMFGLIMIFKDFSPFYGIFGSEFIGFKNFTELFRHPFFMRMLTNTVGIAFLKFITGFPIGIAFALLLNELRKGLFKKTVQTVSYLPHFISWIVVSGMMFGLLSAEGGIFNRIIGWFGGKPVFWYSDAGKWWGILTVSSMWKGLGWGTIVYLAAISNINAELFEAAEIDGAGRFRKMIHVTVPGMMPIISLSLVFGLGGLIKDDFEQIYALVGENNLLSVRTDVFSTWIFKQATTNFKGYGVASALGFMQGIISLILMVLANRFVRKRGYAGLW